MTAIDALGYLAASLVLATFCAKSMVLLRVLAIASNIVFIAYGFEAGLWPILVLHTTMLPLNLLRLREALRDFSPRHNRWEGRALTMVAAARPLRISTRSVGPRAQAFGRTATRRASRKRISRTNAAHLARQGAPRATALCSSMNFWRTQCAARSYSSSP
jgi:hypothetical protein